MAIRKTPTPTQAPTRVPTQTPTRSPEVAPEALQSWLSVVCAFHQCDAVLTRRLAALGLRLGEHEILINLLRESDLTQQQLAQRCFSAKSGISMLATRMAQAGLLARTADAVDARVWRLSLTPRGRALAERAQALQLQVVAAMVDGTPRAELQAITAAMQRASAALQQLQRDDAAT